MILQVSPLLEQLEDRVVPAVFGTPWADASTLSVSFVNDETVIYAPQLTVTGNEDVLQEFPEGAISTSNLFSTFDTYSPNWQNEILKALQTWASAANINLRVIDEGFGIGQPFGSPGLLQGDFAFGDIRIGGMDLGATSVATAIPYDPEYGTWSGDIILNTYYFSQTYLASEDAVHYDLYSIVLHEVGHALGLAGNTDGVLNTETELYDNTSAMFEYYNGERSGLTSVDEAAIQALYGVRQDDRFEGDLRNDTAETATKFMRAARQEYRQTLNRLETEVEAEGVVRLSVNGDITTPADTDWFWYKTTRNNPGFTLYISTLNTSLAELQLTVYETNELGELLLDESNQPIIAYQGYADRTGDAVLTVDGLAPSRMYRIKVSAVDGTDFAVGAYTLFLEADNPRVAARLDAIYDNFVLNATSNDTIETADKMVRADQSTTERPAFIVRGELTTYEDIDVYSLNFNKNSALVQITLMNPGGMANLANMTLRYVDAEMQEVDIPFTVLRQDAHNLVIEVKNLPKGTYYLTVMNETDPELNPGDDWLGAYTLTAQYKLPQEAAPTPVLSGSLSADEATNAGGAKFDTYQKFHTMELSHTQLLDLEFAITGSAGEAVQVSIYDANGNFLFVQSIEAGETVRVQLLLGPGTYNFRFVGGRTDDEAFSNLNYSMIARIGNDPIGPKLVDPSGPPPQRNLTPIWDNPEAVRLILQAIYDPLGALYSDKYRWY